MLRVVTMLFLWRVFVLVSIRGTVKEGVLNNDALVVAEEMLVLVLVLAVVKAEALAATRKEIIRRLTNCKVQDFGWCIIIILLFVVVIVLMSGEDHWHLSSLRLSSFND